MKTTRHAVERLRQRGPFDRLEDDGAGRLLLAWHARGVLVPERVARAMWRREYPADWHRTKTRTRFRLHGSWVVVEAARTIVTTYPVGVEGWASVAVWLMLGWYEDRSPSRL